MTKIVSESKLASAQRNLEFDFSSQLAIGETLSTASVAATVYSGTDASPSSMVSGSASISGPRVTQLIIGGTAGVIYQFVCTVTTSAGQTLILATLVAVVPPIC